MSYKNDSLLVMMNSYGRSNSYAKAELFETYDRIRDLAASGPTLGGAGLGKFGGLLMNVARMFGAADFLPSFGSEAINVPGTSYYTPVSGGTGISPGGGQAAFGLGPMSQVSGFNTGGAAPVDGSPVMPLNSFGANQYGGFSQFGFSGMVSGDAGFAYGMMPNSTLSSLGTWAGGAAPIDASATDFSLENGQALNNGTIAGGALGIGSAASGISSAATAGGLAVGSAAGAGFGRNLVMPAASIVSGIGGLLTTLGPFFGPFGIAAAAGGAVANGMAGAVLNSFQHVSQRLLVNADTILTAKVKNLETLVKQLDAQEDILKKLLKDSLDGDKKALDNI
jgi:hypothetical protein